MNGLENSRNQPECGDYTMVLGSDTPEQRQEGERIMRANGCKRVRFDPIEEDREPEQPQRLVVHGFISAE